MGFASPDTVKKFLGGVPLVEKAIVDSGVILLEYWLEVSEEEETRRLKARIDDGREIWKLSPMDLKWYSRWYDTRRRATTCSRRPTPAPPPGAWPPNDKQRARLNIIPHLLQQIPYQSAPREKVKLPKRQKRQGLSRAELCVQVHP